MRKKMDNSNGTALLSKGVHFSGTVTCKGSSIKIDGDLDGKIISDDKVIIGKQGKITGDIVSEKLIVYGALKGNVKVAQEAKITSTGLLHGNIYLKNATLAIDKGGIFVGKSLDDESGPKKTKNARPALNA